MANLNGVIRLRRFQLDEKRMALADLQRVSTELTAERAKLKSSIEAEKQAALTAADHDAAFAFGGFVQGAIDRRTRLDESLQKLETQIGEAIAQVHQAFADLKKFEQAETKRRALAMQRQARVENIRLDEIGVEGYRRRSN